jgi:hypothetical protein
LTTGDRATAAPGAPAAQARASQERAGEGPGAEVGRARVPRRLAWAGGVAAVTAALYFCYYRQSWTAMVGSDGGSIALQAWDMLHGHVMLHGWTMSDVSFWPTELAQYVLLEALFGLGAGVIHIGGAMTYTLLVLLAAFLARGRATGREGLVRALVAAAIMLAPAIFDATATLLLTPDHLGSAVPVLLAWLLVERLPARWYVPVGAAIILAWGQVADSLVLVTGAAPMLIVGLTRAGQKLWHREPGTFPGRELSLAAAAAASFGIARGAEAIIRVTGGYVLRPVSTGPAGWSAVPGHLKIMAQGLMTIFGAAFFHGESGVGLFSSVLHVIGLAAAAAALGLALWRLGRAGELAVPALGLAILFNLAVYVPSPYVQDLLSTREISGVLPFAAVLAGRLLAGPLLRARLVPALAAYLIACAVVLGYHASLPAEPPQNASLAAWLAAEHLRSGLSPDYWVANSTTLDTGGRITVRQISVNQGTLIQPVGWGFKGSWYDPQTQQAQFIVTSDISSADWADVKKAAIGTYGPPARTFQDGNRLVLVWNANLLAGLR